MIQQDGLSLWPDSTSVTEQDSMSANWTEGRLKSTGGHFGEILIVQVYLPLYVGVAGIHCSALLSYVHTVAILPQQVSNFFFLLELMS